MQTRLEQKQLFKGSRVFELDDDVVNVHIKSRFKQETLTVTLAVLNPEPVINQSCLEFTSRVNNEPLLSLFLAKPNPQEFNDFVNLIKQKAQQEYNAIAGLKALSGSAMEGNSFDEPPEFDAADANTRVKSGKPVNVEGMQSSIQMLTEYVGVEEIGNLLAAMQALQEDPQNYEKLAQLAREFDRLGPMQGAVLTYAPYIGLLLSDDPFS